MSGVSTYNKFMLLYLLSTKLTLDSQKMKADAISRMRYPYIKFYIYVQRVIYR